MPALPSLPCSAITGRNCPLWPGGMEITQLVLMPPRAAEMNEPEILVGKLLPAVGGSNGAGAACGSSGSTRAPKAHTPAAPAPASAPQRSRARRVRSAMGVMMPRRSVLPAQPRRSTGQS